MQEEYSRSFGEMKRVIGDVTNKRSQMKEERSRQQKKKIFDEKNASDERLL